jgi:hypothetical protein
MHQLINPKIYPLFVSDSEFEYEPRQEQVPWDKRAEAMAGSREGKIPSWISKDYLSLVKYFVIV